MNPLTWLFSGPKPTMTDLKEVEDKLWLATVIRDHCIEQHGDDGDPPRARASCADLGCDHVFVSILPTAEDRGRLIVLIDTYREQYHKMLDHHPSWTGSATPRYLDPIAKKIHQDLINKFGPEQVDSDSESA